MRQLFTFILVIHLAVGCSKKNETPVTETNTIANKEVEVKLSPVQKLERAHQKQAFLAKDVVSFDIEIAFGGQQILKGTQILKTDTSKSVLILEDGNKIYTDGQAIYYSPSMENEGMIQFHAFTWSYFFALPYKLSDAGTIWSPQTTVSFKDKKYNAQKLTFTPETGDTPEDWYWIYSNTESNIIEMVTYIVTAEAPKEKAEENPHTITYENYHSIEGIPTANNWKFWEWNDQTGITNQIGEASLKSIKFSTYDESIFKIPEEFKKIQ